MADIRLASEISLVTIAFTPAYVDWLSTYMKKTISRRSVTSGIAAGIFGTFLSSKSVLAGFIGENSLTLGSINLIDEVSDLPVAEQFWLLSRFVTGRDDLERSLTDRLYPYFENEPWGNRHIGITLSRSIAGLNEERLPNTVPELFDANVYLEGEAWFLEHLLTTWYLGIYYHERLTQRVLYEDALMWDTVSDMVPVAGFSNMEYGYWTKPPVVRE